ncbi:MAG: hypothetical protein ACLTSD_04970, partial [Eubacterium sp.]
FSLAKGEKRTRSVRNANVWEEILNSYERALFKPGSIRWLAMQQRIPGRRTKSPGTRKTMTQAPAIVNNRMKVSLMWPVISRTESRRTARNEARRCDITAKI